MPTETYHLIAYDKETGKVVLDWPNVAQHRYCKDDMILDGQNGETRWQVVGVRNTTTERCLHLDVKRA